MIKIDKKDVVAVQRQQAEEELEREFHLAQAEGTEFSKIGLAPKGLDLEDF